MNSNILAFKSEVPEWDQIAGFVRATVERYTADRSPRAVRQAMSVLTAYVRWVHRTSAAPMNDRALSTQLIDYYTVAVRAKAVRPVTAERERKILRAIAGAETGVERRQISTTAHPVVPYSAAELNRFRTWADLQPAAYRTGCVAIVTLAAACGLTRAEISESRGTDVFADLDGAPSLQVRGGRARTVPALGGWEAELDVLAGAGDRRLLPVEHDQVYSHYRDVRGQERPSPQRLRATWLVTHLTNGVQVPVLLSAAGLSSADSLRRSIPFVPAPPEELRVRMLRGASAKGVKS